MSDFVVVIATERGKKATVATPLVCLNPEATSEAKKIWDKYPDASIRTYPVNTSDRVNLIDIAEYIAAEAEYPHR